MYLNTSDKILLKKQKCISFHLVICVNVIIICCCKEHVHIHMIEFSLNITYIIYNIVWRNYGKKIWNKFIFDNREQYATTAIHVFVIVIRWLFFFSFQLFLLLFSSNSVLFYGAFSGFSWYFAWFVTRH